MERKHILIGLVVVLVIAIAGVGALFLTGGGPAPVSTDGGVGGGGEATPTATPVSTGTVYTVQTGTATGNETGAKQVPPFSFEIDNIVKCGQTCRNVTVTLYNNQNESASDVVVFTRIYAGNNTNDDNLVWQGKEDVGTMAPESSYTTTDQVKLSYGEAYQVKQNDGWITILTTVKSSETSITFKNRRDVA